MDCSRHRDMLSDYLSDRLGPRHRRALSRHLEGCPGCAAELAALRRVDALVAGLPERPAPDRWDAVAAALDRATARARPGRPAWTGRFAWAAALAVVLAVILWPRPAARVDDTPFLRDHYRAAAAAPLGVGAMGDLLIAAAEQNR